MNKILYDETHSISKLYDIIHNIFGVDKTQLKSTNRCRKYVEARNVFAVIARRKLLMGTVQVGELLCKDHSSISHYTKTHDDIYEFDKPYKELYDMCDLAFGDQPIADLFKSSAKFTIDDKLNLAYVKLNTLYSENKKLKSTVNKIRKELLSV